MKNEIIYKKGDATAPEKPRSVIAHCCNDIGGWGAGFVVALSKKWQSPERQYRGWFKQGAQWDDGDLRSKREFVLGATQLVKVDNDCYVANIIGQHGVRRRRGDTPIRYDALRQGLHDVGTWAKKENRPVAMPRIGSGLAGGDWNIIASIITEELCERGVSVTVYDL